MIYNLYLKFASECEDPFCNLLHDWFSLLFYCFLIFYILFFLWGVGLNFGFSVRLTPLINGFPVLSRFAYCNSLRSRAISTIRTTTTTKITCSGVVLTFWMRSTVWDLWPFKMQLNLIEARKNARDCLSFHTFKHHSPSLSLSFCLSPIWSSVNSCSFFESVIRPVGHLINGAKCVCCVASQIKMNNRETTNWSKNAYFTIAYSISVCSSLFHSLFQCHFLSVFQHFHHFV